MGFNLVTAVHRAMLSRHRHCYQCNGEIEMAQSNFKIEKRYRVKKQFCKLIRSLRLPLDAEAGRSVESKVLRTDARCRVGCVCNEVS